LLAIDSLAGCAATTAASPRPTSTSEPPRPRPPIDPTASPRIATPVPTPVSSTPFDPAVSPTATAVNPTPTVVPDAALQSKQPNVLLITIDTLRSDHLGTYGFTLAHTPNLDSLARKGLRFARAICQLPQTDPSHAALFTGLYASTSGVRTHMLDKIRPGTQTMASIFAANGYITGGIYSWVSFEPQYCGLNEGFQTYDGYVLNRALVSTDTRPAQLSAMTPDLQPTLPILKTADLVTQSIQNLEATVDGRADVTNRAVFQWLDEHVGKDPFFLWVHYFDPHYPYSPPAGYDHLFGLAYSGNIDGSIATIQAIENHQLVPNDDDKRRLNELYQGEIAFTDSQIGNLLRELKKRGLADDTIIVMAADHGESFGEHNDWVHGLKVYETEIHVPLLFHYPKKLPTGKVVTAPVQLIDVLPTLLELTGLQPSQPIQGRSLVPELFAAPAPAQQFAFTELADRSFVSLTTAEWKIIRNDANGQLQLYHFSDEAEQNNLAGSEATATAEMSAQLQDVMKLSGVSH